MKKTVLSVVAALAASAAPAFAADMPVKAAPAPVAAPSPFDIAFGGAIMTDYIWRGITQSAHNPSVAAYFEPRYNINPNLQLYAGIAGESIKFPNGAAAEIDFYGGVRPTFGPVAFDIGFWYYDYPGGNSSYVTDNFGTLAAIANASFWEVYGKATWTVNDYIAVGGNFYYTPSYLATGSEGTYASATLKLIAPASMLPAGIGAYVSGEFGRQWLGTTDVIPGIYVPAIDLPDYNTWNVGIGFTWKAFTLDLRYSDTDLSEANCYIITGDPHANAAGESNWCGSVFFAKLSVDTSVAGLK